jgi:hypothetical protein
MAVTFNENSMSINIIDSKPVEFWRDLHNELLALIAASEREEKAWATIVLLQAMMPDIDSIKQQDHDTLIKIMG